MPEYKNPSAPSAYAEGGDGLSDVEPDVAPWLKWVDKIKTAEIGNGDTSIKAYAFADCIYLTEVSLPGSVNAMDALAFSGCASLTDLGPPGSICSIGNYAFSGCTSLASIKISSRLVNGSSVRMARFRGIILLPFREIRPADRGIGASRT